MHSDCPLNFQNHSVFLGGALDTGSNLNPSGVFKNFKKKLADKERSIGLETYDVGGEKHKRT